MEGFYIKWRTIKKLITDVEKELIKYPKGHVTEYKIYPDNLLSYMKRRYKCGEDLYSLLQIKEKIKRIELNSLKKILIYLVHLLAFLFLSIDLWVILNGQT